MSYDPRNCETTDGDRKFDFWFGTGFAILVIVLIVVNYYYHIR